MIQLVVCIYSKMLEFKQNRLHYIGLDTLVNRDGRFQCLIEAKSSIADLRTDCVNSLFQFRNAHILMLTLPILCSSHLEQQVIDLLREHLENAQAQVVDARNWTEEIKDIQRQGHSNFNSYNDSLNSAGMVMKFPFFFIVDRWYSDF